MKIRAITNYNYNNNNRKSCENKPTFGHIQLTEGYIKELKLHCGNEIADKVIEFCKKKINLRELIGYDKLPKTGKALADKYFKIMPTNEVEDFSVNFECNLRDMVHNCRATSSFMNFRNIYVKLKSKLPSTEIYGEKATTELAEWAPSVVDTVSLDSSLGGKTTEVELAKERDRIMKKELNEIGFTFGGDSWFPVPSKGLYDVIARKINKQLDLFAEAKSIDCSKQV